MYRCIGKRFDGRTIVECTNTSPTPSISPVTHALTTQYLCSDCANSRTPKRGAQVEHFDLDKPNQPEMEDDESYNFDDLEEIDFDDLEEIEL